MRCIKCGTSNCEGCPDFGGVCSNCGEVLVEENNKTKKWDKFIKEISLKDRRRYVE